MKIPRPTRPFFPTKGPVDFRGCPPPASGCVPSRRMNRIRPLVGPCTHRGPLFSQDAVLHGTDRSARPAPAGHRQQRPAPRPSSACRGDGQVGLPLAGPGHATLLELEEMRPVRGRNRPGSAPRRDPLLNLSPHCGPLNPGISCRSWGLHPCSRGPTISPAAGRSPVRTDCEHRF